MIDFYPFRPKIQSNEALTSYIKRLAQRYLNRIADILDLPKIKGVYPDKIDLYLNKKLLAHLSKNTLISVEKLSSHTLQHYSDNYPIDEKNIKRNNKYPISKPPFILRFNTERSNQGNIRYCPICLSESIPYFRLYWRLGYYTACHSHQILLHNSCPSCNSQIRYFKDKIQIERCYQCNAELSSAQKIYVDVSIVKILHNAFINKNTPINFYTSKEFLSLFWKAYLNLFNMDKKYVKNLLKKFNITKEYDNPLSFHHNLLSLVWKLIQKNEYKLERLIPCLHCDWKFPNRHQLEGHLKYIHIDPSFECELCGELFYQEYDLILHKKIHKEENFRCIFCNSPFTTEWRMTKHYHRAHSEELRERIIKVIESFKEENISITFAKVARKANIPVTVFEKHPEFYNLLSKYRNKFKIRYFESLKLKENERKKTQEEIIIDVIDNLMKKGIKPSRKNILREMEMSGPIFWKKPHLSNLITEKVMLFELERREQQIKNAIEGLKKNRKKITINAIVRETRICHRTINKYPTLINMINEYRN